MRFGKRPPSREKGRRGPSATVGHRIEPAFAEADDRAHYACICGHAFMAVVIASVRCPRCGTAQPW